MYYFASIDYLVSIKVFLTNKRHLKGIFTIQSFKEVSYEAKDKLINLEKNLKPVLFCVLFQYVWILKLSTESYRVINLLT